MSTSYREMLWKQAGLTVLRNNGFMYVDEFDIKFVYTDRVEATVNLNDEKELFLYNLKGGDAWFVTETKKVYNHMREYLQIAGI